MKKLLTSLITGTIIFSTFVVPSASALSPPIESIFDSLKPKIFTDVTEEAPNGMALRTLRNDKTVNGYKDGSFKPNNTINRAEFMTIIMNAKSPGEVEGSNCFPDVNNEWFAPAICKGKELGLVHGHDSGKFEPGQNINLAEASTIIGNTFGLELENGGSWFEPSVKALANKKALPISIDSFNKKLTRGEVVEMIYRIIKNISTKSSKNFDSLKEEIPKISSCRELQDKIAIHQYQNSYKYRDYALDDVLEAMPTMAEDSAGSAQSKSLKSESSSDYSSTNIQVKNVDESDTVKNNGSHIFFIQNNRVKILKAYPADEMQEVATIIPSSQVNPKSLYLYDDTLVVLTNNWGDRGQSTQVYVYDVSDPANPIQQRMLSLDGSEVSSRRIGDDLYLVLRQYQRFRYYDHYEIYGEDATPELRQKLPQYYDSVTGKTSQLVDCEDIIYFPGHRDISFLTVAGIPLDRADKSIHRSVILGSSENIYSSTENLYIASTEYRYNDYEIYDTWNPAVTSSSHTTVRQFALDDGQIEFKGQGEVPGRILNQFSMDEHKNSFRIATTTNGFPEQNNLYVLNKNNLQEIQGRIENIAPGEKIYSTRFMGDKTYMVTFKKVDPFFVIDTSNPYAPRILGKLKLPGYSDYLHPYDENYVIGIGKDTVEAKEGDFAWYQGIKVALFDVRDVKNPRVSAQAIIGDRGTESEALRNHKAVLFSKEKGFIAFPITVAEVKDQISAPDNAYGEFTFQGAHVYNIKPGNINLRGSITHYTDSDVLLKAGSYWYPSNGDIQRILYIGDNFYTISKDEVKASNMRSLQETGSVKVDVDDYFVTPEI